MPVGGGSGSESVSAAVPGLDFEVQARGKGPEVWSSLLGLLQVSHEEN